MKVKEKLKSMLKKAAALEPATTMDACNCKECAEVRPSKMYKVTLTLSESLWHSDIQRYIFVSPYDRNNITVSESKLIEFIETDTWNVRQLLESNLFESIKIETVK